MNTILDILNNLNLKTILVEKGETLFHEDGKCQYVGVIKRGKLKITSFSYAGKEIEYKKVKVEEMFGENLLFSDSQTYKGDVIALEESEIYLLSKEEFISLLQSNNEFLYYFLNYQANNSVALKSQIKLLTMGTAKERMMFYLYSHGGKIKYKNVTELSKSLFLTREATSRLITAMEKELLIAVDKEKKEIIEL